MTISSEEFVKNCIKTESREFHEIIPRFCDLKAVRLLHVAMGMVTEAGELMDIMKCYFFYGKEIDEVNFLEEMGDSDWYKAIGVDVLNSSFEELWEAIGEKLKARYGDRFNVEGAVTRDLDSERKILEKGLKLGKGSGMGDEKISKTAKEILEDING